MFSGSLPVPTFVQRVIWLRQPLARIHLPMIFSDEFISRVVSRTSSVPYALLRAWCDCPPPYRSPVSKKVIPRSTA